MQSVAYVVSDVLRNELRSATRQLHARLDRHPVLSPLMRPGLTRDQYGLVLNALYAINLPVEKGLAGFAKANALPLDFLPYERMSQLVADLRQEGWKIPAPLWSGPRLDSMGDFVGTMYVLVGSALGGQMIFRQIQSSLPASATVGGRYFAGYGESTAELWQGFLEFAASTCSAADLEDARQAACRLFEAMLDRLDALPSFSRNNA
jgi:heme oxygenase